MSFEAVLWATSDAPIANVNEFGVLVMLAERADSDGCSAFPARATVARRTTVDPKTVQRTINALVARKLIGPGDQRASEYIRADRRPPVWDLLIPYDWFPNIERINKSRAEKGKPPLTPESRPPIAPPPAKKVRSDKGKKRPKRQVEGGEKQVEGGAEERGDSESSRRDGPEEVHGGTVNPERGDSQFVTGGLEDPRTSPYEPVTDPVLPSAPVANSGRDGGMDGSRLPQQKIARNPGVDLLLAIGAEKREFLLTGKTLQDQGLTVAGMLLEGWTEEQLRHIIAGRPLPDRIKTSVGAIISGRIRDAFAGPAPSSVPSLPCEYADSEEPGTWTPDEWSPVAQQGRDVVMFSVECSGQDGMCGRPVVAGSAYCRGCSEEQVVAV